MRFMAINSSIDNIHYSDSWAGAAIYGAPIPIPIFMRKDDEIKPIMDFALFCKYLKDGWEILEIKYEHIKDTGRKSKDGLHIYSFGEFEALLMGAYPKSSGFKVI